MNTIGIIGMGLIGGSLGLAFKKYVKNVRVFGCDINQEHQEYALKKGIIDCALDKNNIKELKLLFLAIPVRSVIKVLTDIQSNLNYQQTLITDVGSTKTYLSQKISLKFPEMNYIGGHPMAGKETSGPMVADADLFKNKNYILMKPEKKNLDDELGYLESIISQFKCNVIKLKPEVHDKMVAFSSHLPQLLSTCLMNEYIQVEKELTNISQLAGSGFKDMSRIAASEPSMWLDIFLTNKENVLKKITDMEKQIASFKNAIAKEDEETIEKLMNSGRKKKIQMEKGELS